MFGRMPLVYKKNGEIFTPEFPVELSAGERLVIVRVAACVEVPEGQKWTVVGFDLRGPIIQSEVFV